MFGTRRCFISSYTQSLFSCLPYTATINRGAWWLLFAGILLFSGSLYLLALIPQARNWLGPVTPLGGLCFLAGWAWLVIAPTK